MVLGPDPRLVEHLGAGADRGGEEGAHRSPVGGDEGHVDRPVDAVGERVEPERRAFGGAEPDHRRRSPSAGCRRAARARCRRRRPPSGRRRTGWRGGRASPDATTRCRRKGSPVIPMSVTPPVAYCCAAGRNPTRRNEGGGDECTTDDVHARGRVLVTDGVVYVRELDESDDEVVRIVAESDDPVAAVGQCLRVGARALQAAHVSVDVEPDRAVVLRARGPLRRQGERRGRRDRARVVGSARRRGRRARGHAVGVPRRAVAAPRRHVRRRLEVERARPTSSSWCSAP